MNSGLRNEFSRETISSLMKSENETPCSKYTSGEVDLSLERNKTFNLAGELHERLIGRLTSKYTELIMWLAERP